MPPNFNLAQRSKEGLCCTLTGDNIILSVRSYLRFKLSYRDLAQIMGELGVSVAPCTILRWVIRYSVEFAELWRRFEENGRAVVAL